MQPFACEAALLLSLLSGHRVRTNQKPFPPFAWGSVADASECTAIEGYPTNTLLTAWTSKLPF